MSLESEIPMHRETLRPSLTDTVRLLVPKSRVGLRVVGLMALVMATPFMLRAEAVLDPTPTRDMTQMIELDLRTDPRKDCQVQGPV